MSQATICEQKDLIANSGICAMVEGQQAVQTLKVTLIK